MPKDKNYWKFSSFLIQEYKVDAKEFGVFQSTTTLQQFYNTLLKDETHKEIGELFKQIKIIVNADLESLHINYYIELSNQMLNIENTEVSFIKEEQTQHAVSLSIGILQIYKI